MPSQRPNKRRKTSKPAPAPTAGDDIPEWEPHYAVVLNSKNTSLPRYTDTSDFDASLDLEGVSVENVGGNHQWHDMDSYKRFKLEDMSESIRIGQCVSIRGENIPGSTREQNQVKLSRRGKKKFRSTDVVEMQWWHGQVLECRAFGSDEVYLRIAWLYRPEDIEGGRKDYHGRTECIPSNDQQIINACTVCGPIEVVEWDAEIPPSRWDDDNVLVWRQTMNVHGTKKKNHDKVILSELKRICVCDRPVDPDEIVLCCKSCRRCLDEECILAAAIKEARELEANQAGGGQDVADIAAEAVELVKDAVASLAPNEVVPSPKTSFGRVWEAVNPFKPRTPRKGSVAPTAKEVKIDFVDPNDTLKFINGSDPVEEMPNLIIDNESDTDQRLKDVTNGIEIDIATEAKEQAAVGNEDVPVCEKAQEFHHNTPQKRKAETTLSPEKPLQVSQSRGRTKGVATGRKRKNHVEKTEDDETAKYTARIEGLFGADEERLVIVSKASADIGEMRVMRKVKLRCLFQDCRAELV